MADNKALEVRATGAFIDWLGDLRDPLGRKAIRQRIARLELGLFGDMRSVGGGVAELRVAVGPGYRVYFTRRGRTVVVLLCGGDKGSQTDDITRARAFAAEWSGPDAS